MADKPEPPPMQTVRRGLIEPSALWVLVPLVLAAAALWLLGVIGLALHR